MAFNYQSLQKKLPVWFRHGGAEGDVILGVMGRLVRNLPGHAFPGWSTAEGRKAVADILLPAILEQPGFKTAWHAEMTELDYGLRRALLERRQLSPCMAARRDGCHVIINRPQDTVVMLNEEEHLAIHCFVDDLDFHTLLQKLLRLPEALSERMTFARNERMGYLTSLPGEAGDGIQLYSVLHLPGMALSNMIPQINRGIEKLQLNIAPFYPQLGDECGNIFVVYTNPSPLGELEDTLERLTQITYTLTERENQVRERLKELPGNGDVFVLDRVNRSYGLMKYARAITAAEWADAISLLRFGVTAGYISADDATQEELLAELALLTFNGGDFARPRPPAVRRHPREASSADIARTAAAYYFTKHTILHSALNMTE